MLRESIVYSLPVVYADSFGWSISFQSEVNATYNPITITASSDALYFSGTLKNRGPSSAASVSFTDYGRRISVIAGIDTRRTGNYDVLNYAPTGSDMDGAVKVIFEGKNGIGGESGRDSKGEGEGKGPGCMSCT